MLSSDIPVSYLSFKLFRVPLDTRTYNSITVCLARMYVASSQLLENHFPESLVVATGLVFPSQATTADLVTDIDNVLVRQNKTQDSERCSWKKAI